MEKQDHLVVMEGVSAKIQSNGVTFGVDHLTMPPWLACIIVLVSMVWVSKPRANKSKNRRASK